MGESSFHEVPEVASNDLAFAIRDSYPVSPGHSLVIPRRVVATWDETTPAERSALTELMSLVKDQLRTELNPDGFNIGFNEGAAAGQTVFHLHIHVVPRKPGDGLALPWTGQR